MREKIRFFRNVLEPNGAGGSTSTEVTIWEPQGAKVEEVNPSIDMIATQQNITQLIRIKCRYNPEIAILNGDKIEWRGFIFNALMPKVDRIKRKMEIMAFSEIESTDRENETSSGDIIWDGGSPDTVFETNIDGGEV